MSQGQTHYEVFARKRPDSAWTLQYATEDRAKALETAEELLADRRAASVKVCKETLDEGAQAFSSVTILSKGAPAPTGKTRPERAEDGPLCVSPSDLYTVHARDRITRLLDGWLRRHKATAFELLHRPDLVEALESGGVDLQHAVQKIAIPEAQARGVSTHEMMRTFQKLTDRSIERVRRDGRGGRFPALTPRTFAEAAEGLSEDAEQRYRLGGGVAAYIGKATGWSGKVDRILDLADAAPPGKGRAAALAVLEQPLSEILCNYGALGDLIGPDLDLGGSLSGLTRLVAPEAVEQILHLEPRLSACFQPLAPGVARLARWLQHDAFEMGRAGVGRRLLRELRGVRRLRPSDPEEEIVLLRGLAMALTAASGKLLAVEEVQEAFVMRSRGLVGGDFVASYLEERGGPVLEAQALVRLAENVAGPLNKKSAARWILTTVTALRFEREVREGGESPAARLAGLAALQKSVCRAGLSEGDEQEIVAALGHLGGFVEADSRLVSLLARAPAPPLQRLTLMLKIASGEAAPLGPAAERGRAEAKKLLRDPDVRAELAAAPAQLASVKALIGRAGLAA